jgi:RND family efflux transporter MFP subunit
MKSLPIQKRTWALIAVIVPLLALFAYVALRSGPLAPVVVTTTTVESRPLSPALFGIGTVEARHTYKIGPTIAARVKQLYVDVGEQVESGQLLGEMEPVDLDDRIHAQSAAVKSAAAALQEAESRQTYAKAEAHRYEQLLTKKLASDEMVAGKRHELKLADSVLQAARENLSRSRHDYQALLAQRDNLRLVAPVDGLVVAREADPGTTMIAGQAIIQLIDPASLWINTRFDQISASGLAADLPATVTLRSRAGQVLSARVMRIEPLADAVTEETLAKVIFEQLPEPLPPLGELAEVTVQLPALPTAPVIPNAAVRRVGGELGVWQLFGDDLRFTPIRLGASDLDGLVQVRSGLAPGDRVVVYSEKALKSTSRIQVVEHLPGAPS